MGALVQGPFLVLLGFAGGATVLPVAMSVAFFHFVTQPAGNHLVADFTPPHLRGLGYGIYFFVSFGAGALGASVGGWVSDRAGLSYAFPALAALLLPQAVTAEVGACSSTFQQTAEACEQWRDGLRAT